MVDRPVRGVAHVRTLPKTQDGSRRYQVRYVGPDGRERAKTFGRKADADRFAASVETDKARGEWIDPRLGKTTVADWAEGWLGRLAHVQPKTKVGYQSLLKTCVLPTFGSTPLARVEQPAVAAWVAELRVRGLSAFRIRQAYPVLSSLMAAAVQGGYIGRTPCTGIRLPRRDAPLLSASDVNGQLVYGPTKTFERQWVRLPDFLVERLARQLEGVGPDPDEFVFRGGRGAPLRYQSFRRAVWDRAVVDAGLSEGLTPHCLRHTCASLLIAGGADPVAVQRHLGHRT